MASALFIVNKAGGLVYTKQWTELGLTGNEYLQLASTFHSVHLISAQVSPVGRGTGIERMETAGFTLQCLQTLTGLKLFATARKGTQGVGAFLGEVYVAYSDYVCKNPWHEPDMPIRFELFDQAVEAARTSRYG